MNSEDAKWTFGCLGILAILAVGVWPMVSPIVSSKRDARFYKEMAESMRDDMLKTRRQAQERMIRLRKDAESAPDLKMALFQIDVYTQRLREEFRVNVPIWLFLETLSDEEILELGLELTEYKRAGLWLEYLQRTAPIMREKFGELSQSP